ncbi:unnamed protein product [Acanthoscelides obtectus]|uniref:Uncharacterized protein n=1 Tax=Acanthoscelides obtectus TaxID=200917 RepID=A0A9P0KWQ0_ACAOB|nr:unnamed protein product [Acanthoscelides obtectus]CAK1656148.1 hypothetical protein AOBTE_LOCUS19592 [Acanthoscelides obtectus]
MDVLVLWADGTRNVVDSGELKLIGCKTLSIGCKVKMLYEGKWYSEEVRAVEKLDESGWQPSEDIVDEDLSVSSDDLPLSTFCKIVEEKSMVSVSFGKGNRSSSDDEDGPLRYFAKKAYGSKMDIEAETNEYDSFSDDSDADPSFGKCEVRWCKDEVGPPATNVKSSYVGIIIMES